MGDQNSQLSKPLSIIWFRWENAFILHVYNKICPPL